MYKETSILLNREAYKEREIDVNTVVINLLKGVLEKLTSKVSKKRG